MKFVNQTIKLIGGFLYRLLLLFFLIGAALMSINLLGMVLPFRNPAVYQLGNGNDITLTYEETLAQINKFPDESETEYVYRLTDIINHSLAQYWADEGIDTYRMRVPIWENYILWFRSFDYPRTYLRYEITDYKRALERGIGLCSEHSIIMEQILEENGLEARIIGLYGHVVASAKADGKWFIVDADQGIVMPYSLEEVENKPDIVLSFYENTWNPEGFVSFYTSPENNKQFDSARSYTDPATVDFEYLSYQYIWMIPLILMAPFTLVKMFIFLRRALLPGADVRKLLPKGEIRDSQSAIQ